MADGLDKLELPETEHDSLVEYFEENYSNSDCEEWFNIDCNDIEQCTGLKDKNGKLIYEGDIIETCDDEIGYVEWTSDAACYQISCDNIETVFDYYESGRDLEVLGNIHEDKELLND